MTPTEHGGGAPASASAAPPVYRWYHKVSAVVFITVCLEIGFFLLIFPWSEYWEGNYFIGLAPLLNRHWNNLYLRGAFSGLGVVNLYISVLEVFRLRRFGRH
jgi:hypothetical protein